MQRTVSYTKQDHKRNKDILNALKIKSVMDSIQNYQKKMEHVKRMNTERIPK